MLKWEKKLIDWFNRHMLLIAGIFVVLAAGWMRMAGRNYVGNDYHCSLYDVPGNCNALLFRRLGDFLMLHFADTTIALLKMLAYGGDFAVALLALVICRKKTALQNVLILAAFLLSPVTLLYSVSGMKMDSVCMSLLLLGFLSFRNQLPVLGVLFAAAAGFLYPPYWPVSIGFGICMFIRKSRRSPFTLQWGLAALLMAASLLLSIFLEQQGGSFWGKIFVTNLFTGEIYSDFRSWILGMCRIYGYVFAMGLTLLAVRYQRLRIPALSAQTAVLMYIGWQQTSFMAL